MGKSFLKVKLYACLTLMVISALFPSKVFATDYGFYSSNDILFYEPDACGGDTTSAGSSNGTVVAIGDSVLAGASNDVKSKLNSEGYDDVTIDAVVSRSLVSPGVGDTTGLQAVDTNATKIKSSGTIMVNLGTNFDGNFKSNLVKMISKIRGINSSARILWTNVGTTSPSAANAMKETNGIIDSQKTSQNYTVIDWGSAVKDKPSLVPTAANGGDGIHPGAAGDAALAGLIATSLGKAGTSSPGSGGAPIKGTTQQKTAAQVWNYLTGNKDLLLSAEQAAGFLGNMQAESGIEPGQEEIATGAGYGLVQWTGGRRTNLENYAKDHNQPVSSLDLQLDFFRYELLKSYKGPVYDPLKKMTSVRAATVLILDAYEAPEDTSSGVEDQRTEFAEKWYKYFGGYIGDGSGSGCASQTQPTTIGAPTIIKMFSGAAVKAMDHGPLVKPDAFVIHFTQSSQLEGMGIPNYFLSLGSGYGIQFQIGPTGKIYEFFPMDNMRYTWHTGGGINSHSIGVEITGADGMQLINSKAQFNAVASLSKYVCDYYKMPCSDPKGDITNSSASEAQGLLGHDEVPGGGHVDPDVSEPGNVNICTDKTFTDSDRRDAGTHAYMLKLRRALGYNKFVIGKDNCADGGSMSKSL